MKKFTFALLLTLIIGAGTFATPQKAEAATHIQNISCPIFRCDDTFTTLSYTTEWMMSFYACPTSLCNLVGGDTYIFNVCVRDSELCKIYNYRVTFVVAPYEDWVGSYPEFTDADVIIASTDVLTEGPCAGNHRGN